jgi:hypothetical protein
MAAELRFRQEEIATPHWGTLRASGLVLRSAAIHVMGHVCLRVCGGSFRLYKGRLDEISSRNTGALRMRAKRSGR